MLYFTGDAYENIFLFPEEIRTLLFHKEIFISRGNKLIKSDNKVIWRGNNKGFLLQTVFHTAKTVAAVARTTALRITGDRYYKFHAKLTGAPCFNNKIALDKSIIVIDKLAS